MPTNEQPSLQTGGGATTNNVTSGDSDGSAGDLEWAFGTAGSECRREAGGCGISEEGWQAVVETLVKAKGFWLPASLRKPL